jgi:hypothetical protein
MEVCGGKIAAGGAQTIAARKKKGILAVLDAERADSGDDGIRVDLKHRGRIVERGPYQNAYRH